MSQIGQTYYRIPGDYTSSSDSLSYLSNISESDLYTDVVAAIGASQLTKVGVQAPPGTQMVLNQIKSIMIGRTGIYELDEDIAITELYFIRPKTYTIDTTNTEKNQATGLDNMQDAKTKYEEKLATLDPEDETYYSQLNDAIATYEAAYSAGYALYIKTEYTATEGDLENVIIDYIYE